MNCKRRVEELCRLIRELEVFEQFLRGDFEIEIRQSQADVLEQTGSGVFVQALELRIGEPNVRDWVKAAMRWPIRTAPSRESRLAAAQFVQGDYTLLRVEFPMCLGPYRLNTESCPGNHSSCASRECRGELRARSRCTD